MSCRTSDRIPLRWMILDSPYIRVKCYPSHCINLTPKKGILFYENVNGEYIYVFIFAIFHIREEIRVSWVNVIFHLPTMYRIYLFLSIIESLFVWDQCLFHGLLLPNFYHSANYYLSFRDFDFLLRGFARGIKDIESNRL